MAIIKNSLSMMMKGKVGAFSYYVADTRQVVRQAQNNSNYGENATRTVKQQERRVTWANLVNFYTANKSWMKKAFETLAPGVSVYNRFIQLNINRNKIALTKDEARAKLWVVSPLQVTQGSLPSITNDSPFGKLSGLNANSTIGQLSQKIIDLGSGFQEGDAIVCVKFTGTTAAPGSTEMKTAGFTYDELLLDSSSTEAVPDWLAFQAGPNLFDIVYEGQDAMVLIHTRQSGGKLLVSTETIMFTEGTTVSNLWNASAQITNAIESYGQFEVVPLSPDGSGATSVSSGSAESGGSGGSGGSGDSGGGGGDLGD